MTFSGSPWNDLRLTVRSSMCTLVIFQLFRKVVWCTASVSFLEPIRLVVRELRLTVGSGIQSPLIRIDVKPLRSPPIANKLHTHFKFMIHNQFPPMNIVTERVSINWVSNPYKGVPKARKKLSYREISTNPSRSLQFNARIIKEEHACYVTQILYLP